jgi:hypothetical protein
MKKLLVLLMLFSISVYAKDFNPTCEGYQSRVDDSKDLKDKIKIKMGQLKDYEKVSYSKSTIKALKKELKKLNQDKKRVDKDLKLVSKSIDKRIKILKNNFNSKITMSSKEIIAKCANYEYKKVQFSKILLEQVIPPKVIVQPNPDVAELTSCLANLEEVKNNVAGITIDNGSLDELRRILEIVPLVNEDLATEQ